MKIGIDARKFFQNDTTGQFIREFTSAFLEKNKIDSIIVFSDIGTIGINKNNLEIKRAPTNNIFFLTTILREKLDLMIFFGEETSIMYTKKAITFPLGTHKLFYPNEDTNTTVKKHKYNFFVKSSLSSIEHIVCLSNNLKYELNEKLNIKEEKMDIIIGPFLEYHTDKPQNFAVDIKMKNNINNDYLLYHGTTGEHKNLKKLIETLAKMNENSVKTSLVLLGENTYKNLELRDLVVSLNLEDKIHFISYFEEDEIEEFYKQSIGVVFPSLYEVFPFELSTAVKYNIPIIASNIPTIKEIFDDEIDYFFPLSPQDMQEKITDFIKNKNKPDYKHIREKYNMENTINDFMKLIKR